MGADRKEVRFQDDEIDYIERRRSSRIIALEEKKQQEIERKVTLALAKKNTSTNHIVDRNKGKAKMDEGDHLDDFREDKKHGPSKKGHKRKELDQLVSSIQEGRHINSTTTSGTNVSSLYNVLEKHVLELAIDFLQRKDEEELFHEPINPDMVKNYNQLVKEPMDFGTIRAKIHENLYTNLEDFKRDVYLLCFNAMNVFPETSRYYKMAEVIGFHAMRLFKDLGVDSEHFDLDFSLSNKLLSKKPQDRELENSLVERFSLELAGKSNVTPSAVPETQKRHMYLPSSKKQMVVEVLNFNKSNIQALQVNKDPVSYKDSLLRFVEDLGPTAQGVATKKLEALKFEKLSDGDDDRTLKLFEKFCTTLHEQTKSNTLSSAQILSLALPFFNKSLAFPRTSTQHNKNFSTMLRSVNIMDDTNYKGKKIITNDNWHASAAILLSSNFYNNNKGKNHIGINSSNEKRTLENCYLSKFGVIENWNTWASSSSSGLANVYPTCVVLAPQPLESITGNVLSKKFPLSQPNIVAFNENGSSFSSQPSQEESMTGMPINHLSDQFLTHHQLCSSMSGLNVPFSASIFSQLNEDECIPKQSIRPEVTIYPSKESDTSSFGLGTPYHPGDFQALMGSQDFNNIPYQKHENSQLNHLNPTSLKEPKSSSALEISGGGMNCCGGIVAQEDTDLQLLWDGDQQPNLDLQL